jgi:uncharacterized protein YkwD
MRALAVVGALSALVLAASPEAVALPRKPARVKIPGHVHRTASTLERLIRNAAWRDRGGAHNGPRASDAQTVVLSALESEIVARINAQRGARGLRSLRVSRGLTASASYHSHQMGLLGFFEHESRNGTPFWRRIARFYPAGRGYWSVGENIFWESPDTTGASAVHEWMSSSPHRRNILTREWREVGVSAVHFAAAPGAFGGRPVTIVTADFGVRR